MTFILVARFSARIHGKATEYDTKHPGENTDDDGRIEVYDSREAAEKAGVVMD
jgi:hypothetical protein